MARIINVEGICKTCANKVKAGIFTSEKILETSLVNRVLTLSLYQDWVKLAKVLPRVVGIR